MRPATKYNADGGRSFGLLSKHFTGSVIMSVVFSVNSVANIFRKQKTTLS